MLLPLDIAATWTRILSVVAGARVAAGGPGPGTRLGSRSALDWNLGPWLGLLDFQGLRRVERDLIDPWLRDRIGPLLLVRHLLLARPLLDEVFIELRPDTLAALPEGWRDAPRPILLLLPCGRSRPGRSREFVDALSRLHIPLTAAGSDLWAIREYDPAAFCAIAQLSDPTARANFRASLDSSQTRLFDAQLPAAEAALLDDLVGARDEEGSLALEMGGLSALYPQAHPLAVYGAVERANNASRPLAERTQFSAKTIEARLTGRSFPEAPQRYDVEFARRACAVAPMLPEQLQRVFDASALLLAE